MRLLTITSGFARAGRNPVRAPLSCSTAEALTDLGEFEIYGDSWWLPGFISGAGGVAPGTGPDFPSNSWVSTAAGLADTVWRDFRWIVAPDRQEIWYDEDDDGFGPEDLRAVMPLPQSSSAPLYRYFTSFEGIRLYWRGAGSPGDSGDPGQVFVDHLRVTVTPLSSPAPVPALSTWGIALLAGLLNDGSNPLHSLPKSAREAFSKGDGKGGRRVR